MHTFDTSVWCPGSNGRGSRGWGGGGSIHGRMVTDKYARQNTAGTHPPGNVCSVNHTGGTVIQKKCDRTHMIRLLDCRTQGSDRWYRRVLFRTVCFCLFFFSLNSASLPSPPIHTHTHRHARTHARTHTHTHTHTRTHARTHAHAHTHTHTHTHTHAHTHTSPAHFLVPTPLPLPRPPSRSPESPSRPLISSSRWPSFPFPAVGYSGRRN